MGPYAEDAEPRARRTARRLLAALLADDPALPDTVALPPDLARRLRAAADALRLGGFRGPVVIDAAVAEGGQVALRFTGGALEGFAWVTLSEAGEVRDAQLWRVTPP